MIISKVRKSEGFFLRKRKECVGYRVHLEVAETKEHRQTENQKSNSEIVLMGNIFYKSVNLKHSGVKFYGVK